MAYLTNRFLYHILFITFFSIYFYSDSIFVLFFAIILSFCKFRLYATFVLAFFDFIYSLFLAFFAREIKSYDIYLFFTHIQETFETFNQIVSIAVFPALNLFFCIGILYIFSKIRFFTFKFSFLGVGLFLYIFPLSFNSAYFISQIIEYIDVLAKPQKQKEYKQKDIRAINHTDKNIVLIFGESLREDIFRDGEFYQKYKDLKNFHYSKATTLGTNTDVVVPLFINATNDLNNLNRDRNLFKLAKKEGYKTYFFSTQYDKALKYINGYLELDSIDEYANGKKSSLDEFLIEKIKGVDFGQRSLVVLQMYGTHSPYKRYPKEYKKFNPKDNSLNEQIKSDYKNSFLYTEYILDRLLNHIKDSSKKETIVIFVSDHGELINSEYGHNQFKKEIYTVPSFVYTINSNYSFKKKDIYQLDLANIVLENLGYEKITVKRPYKVNGTMITGEDGFILVN